MAFAIGQKVAFEPSYKHVGEADSYLKRGSVYTVQGHCTSLHRPTDPPGIFLCEVRAIIKNGLCECFAATLFRPVIERSTDTGMAILRKLLDGDKIKEKV